MRKTILILLCLMFIAMGSFAAYQIYLSLSEYNEGTSTYENLQGYVSVDKTDSDTTDEEETQVPEEVINWPTVDFDTLTDLNDDIVGWIYLDGTHVNYPIVQGPDNAYYLNKMYDGTGNGAGSIYMDYRNQSDFTDVNTIIYGHHMINDSMLSDITLYKKQSFYDTHPYLLIMTPEKNYKFEVLSGYVATLEDNAWPLSFGSQEAIQNWIDFTVSKSAFISNVTPTLDDRYVTLSTCTYEFEEARFVLIGVLREYAVTKTE